MSSFDLAGVQRVLVVKPSSLGDIVHTLPVVQALADAFPAWQIDWLAHRAWLPLLEGHPNLRRVVEFPRQQLAAWGARKFWPWLRRLRAEGRYELSLDFQGLQRSALIARFVLTGGEGEAWGLGKVREGAGFWMHRQAPNLSSPVHALERYLSLANLAGLKKNSNQLAGAILPQGLCPVPAHKLAAQSYLVVHPYSRGEGKALSLDLLAQLLEALNVKQPKQVVLVGRAENWQQLENLPAGVLDLSNQTSLPELCWLLRNAAGVISVDSGPMHLAASLDVPLLGLHAWSDPRLVGPWRPAGMTTAWVWSGGELLPWNTLSHSAAELPSKADALDESAVLAALSWVDSLS